MKHICDQGYTNLVNAIVRRAAEDYMLSTPGTYQRKEVEQFFLGGYFEDLTGADGEYMLQVLKKKYDAKHGKKPPQVRVRNKHKRSVLCVETGVAYESMSFAGGLFGVKSKDIARACETGWRAGGVHWRYVEDEK